MHCCEFCLTDYKTRPQVKNPRACEKPVCQGLRQRANEREWHNRNQGLYDSKYHAIMRERRLDLILLIAGLFRKCMQIGASLSGMDLKAPEFGVVLEKFLLGLGVRQINKFWSVDKSHEFAELANSSR